MKNRRKRSYGAFVLCVILLVHAVYQTESCPVVMAAQTLEDIQEQVAPDAGLPPGGLQRPEAYRVDEEEASHVPSYEGRVSRYSRTQTIFQRGTGTYGYQNLSAAQQEFYLTMEAALTRFNSSEDAVFEKISFSGGDVRYTPFKADFSKFGLEKNEAFQTWAAFRSDHPWMFWLGAVAYTSVVLMPLVGEDYQSDPSAVRDMYDTIETGVSGYLSAAEEACGTYEKVRVVYDRLINEINYAYQADGNTPQTADWAHCVVGVFDGVHSSAVCEGYSKAFSFLMNILGIPNVYIVGASSEGGHAWNAVSFDGGATYYYVDATWDDTNGKNKLLENQYVYFAMPKTVFEKRHTPDTVEGEGLSWQYGMPVLGDDMEYTYFVRYAAYGTGDMLGDTASVNEFLKAARVLAPGETCLYLLPDKEALKKVASALGVTGGYSYSTAKDYSMVLYSHPAEKFAAEKPAGAFSLSETELTVDGTKEEEAVLTVSSATQSSDDYITFYSSNERVAAVKDAYVKAKAGERIRIALRGKGTADIYAKSSAGKATVSCRVTVTNGDPEETPEPTAMPTETPAATPMVTPVATPEVTAEPTATPIAAPEETVSPTVKPTAEPTAKPTVTPEPTATPIATPTAAPGPTVKPTAEPTAKPTVTPEPTATPIATPTAAPGPTVKPTAEPTAKPTVTERPTITPTVMPTAAPGKTASPTVKPTKKPTATRKPTAKPSETPEPAPAPEITANPTAEPTVPPEPTAAPETTKQPTAEPAATPTGKPAGIPGQTAVPGTVLMPSPAPAPGETSAPVGQKKNMIKKGTRFVAGNLRFKVTKLKGRTGEVTVTGVKSKKAISIVIPDKIRKNGISFTVTSIQKNAFKGCKKVRKLKISATGIKKMAKSSLNGLGRNVRISVAKSKLSMYRKVLKQYGFTMVK